MKLTATPFNPTTGELLPVYRDAYLRGDLARASAQAVERYLRRDDDQAHGTVTRWHELQSIETVAAPSWVQQRLRFIREQPQRFRRRAGSFMLVAAALVGVSMASTMRPGINLPVERLAATDLSLAAVPAALEANAAATAASAARTVVVHGRILNEKGLPLAGATVLRKGTAQGTSTDAQGNYSLRVPATDAVLLQYGYGGYAERELPAAQASTQATVALQPKAAVKHRRWLLF